MDTYDLSIHTLNSFGVPFSQKEMIGIRMANGMFDDGAKPYFVGGGPFSSKTSIGYIIHWADWIATRAEQDEQRQLLGL
jgi:hypothetical protein